MMVSGRGDLVAGGGSGPGGLRNAVQSGTHTRSMASTCIARVTAKLMPDAIQLVSLMILGFESVTEMDIVSAFRPR